MSSARAKPEALAVAARKLQGIGAMVTTRSAAVAAPTAGVTPAAADEVSAAVALSFVAQAQTYQAVSTQGAAIHAMIVNFLSAGATSRESGSARGG